jgi:bacillopeptidase F
MQAGVLAVFLLFLALASAASEEVEIAYDDGEAMGLVFQEGGSARGVRFTPPTYPVRLTTARIYLGVHSTSCDAQAVWILDDDGEEGQPGSGLFGPVAFTAPTETGWFEIGLPKGSEVVVLDGDFYIAFVQQSETVRCTSLGLDTRIDELGRQWQYQDGLWEPAMPFADFMIRAVVETEVVSVEGVSWGQIKAQFPE